VTQRSRAFFAPNLCLGSPKGVGIDRLSGVGASACGGLSSALGVVRCGCSAGCVLCVLCAVGHIGCCVGEEYPVGVSISSSSPEEKWGISLLGGGIGEG